MFPTVFVGTGVRGGGKCASCLTSGERCHCYPTTIAAAETRPQFHNCNVPEASGKTHNATRNRDAVYDEAHCVGSHGSVPVTQRGCGMKI